MSFEQTEIAGGDATPSVRYFDFTWKGPDGQRLSGREWPSTEPTLTKSEQKIPVLCLPGLSRNTRDFGDIAAHLQGRGHRVIALDYRGRGNSDWDSDWRNYALSVEERDIDAAVADRNLTRFVLLGTSRGGLHALAMSNRYTRERMAGVIFNDVGPHIEMRAIHRIAATLGHHMKNTSFQEVADNLKRTIGIQFPGFLAEDWRRLAGQLASEKEGKVVLDYDPKLAHQLASLDDAAPAPDLWHLYENLIDRPVMVLRGEHSDLLSQETCQKMLERHPNAQCHAVPGQGHAPVLWESEVQLLVSGFANNFS